MRYRHKTLLWTVLILIALGVLLLVEGEVRYDRILVILAVSFALELVDSGLGMGYGTILTPTMLLLGYDPADIVPTILISELLSGFAASFFHHEIRNVELGIGGRHLKPALVLAAGSLAGVTAGVFLAKALPTTTLRIVIGCIILASGLFVVILSRRGFKYRTWKVLSLATVASFNKAVSGGGYGPLVTSGQILSGVAGNPQWASRPSPRRSPACLGRRFSSSRAATSAQAY